jgi:hypothetical protein
LTKIEGILPEEASAIGGAIGDVASATGTCNSPTVASVGAMVPEQHPSMATTLKHLEPYKMPPSANTSSGNSTAPTVQAIVVNCVSIVNPQLAPIIGDNLEVIAA